MNKEALTAHLQQFHQQVIDKMYPVVGFRVPPVSEISLRPLLSEGGLGIDRKKGSQYIFISDSEDTPAYSLPIEYSAKTIFTKEVTTVHETGHHIHSFLETRERKVQHETREEWTERDERILRYDELVAEFFTCCYYQRTGMFEMFLQSQLPPDTFYGSIYTLYQAIPSALDEQEQTCRWLITHAYSDVKRQFHRTPTTQLIGRFVREE